MFKNIRIQREVLFMSFREDYYKFTHLLMPHAAFNYGRLLTYRMLRDERAFIENLKKTWSVIELEDPQCRNDPPDFSIDITYPNVEHTVIIITIPQAAEAQEAIYIGITYDKDDRFRYFTYELGKGISGETIYFLCEWTRDGEHVNYGAYDKRDKSVFIKGLSDLLVYELL